MRIDDTWGKEALSIIECIDANILITSLNKRYSYDECRQFDLIASCTTGTDHIDNREIPLLSLQGETEFLSDVWATAEHTMALILSLARRIPWAFDSVKRGEWDRESFQGAELKGKQLGIIGYGRIGKQIARMAFNGFGMWVRAVDVVNWDGSEFDPVKYKETLDFVLQTSDIITVHVPLNESTRGMFGIEQFRQMKPTAYFINTSRGAVVDTHALFSALHDGIIAGAALDVIEGEPKLRWIVGGMPNLIITPHLGGNTAESREKTQIHIAQRIKEYINGL